MTKDICDQTKYLEITASKAALPIVLPHDDLSKNIIAEIFKNVIQPFNGSAGVCKNILDRVATILHEEGVPRKSIKAGLLIFLTMNSARLGSSFSTIIQTQDNAADAEILISKCKRLVPQESVVEITNFSSSDFYTAGDLFKKKVLICNDLNSVKRIASDLQSLILTGEATKQVTTKSKFEIRTTPRHIQGPVAFIGIETKEDSGLFNHASFLRIPLYDEAQDFRVELLNLHAEGLVFEKNLVQNYLRQFEEKKIRIPFEAKLSSLILNQRPDFYRHKMALVHKIISICTIFNNPAPPRITKLLAEITKNTEDDLLGWLRPKFENLDLCAKEDKEIRFSATQLEYDTVKNLLNNTLPIRQRITFTFKQNLFQIVKTINLQQLQSSTFQDDESSMLFVLNSYENYWAKIEFIYKYYNKSKPTITSIQKIESELAEMKKIGLIEKRKFKDKDQHGYFICTLNIDQGILMPSADELFE